jgi:hypothetical protein
MINILCELCAGFKLRANPNDIPEFCLTIYVFIINGKYIFNLVIAIDKYLCLHEGEHNSELFIFQPSTETCKLFCNFTCYVEWI